MIVPRTSLILLAAITFIPLLGMAVSVPAFLGPALGILGLAVLVAAGDAWSGIQLLQTFRVQLPARLRWIQGRAAKLDLIVETHQPKALRLRLGLAFPPELVPKDEELSIDLPARAGKHTIVSDCMPLRRGLFTIEGCFYEFSSGLGLWDIRGRNLQPTEVRAYPSLESERKQVASLFLRTNRIGTKAMRQLGQGREFEKLREYVPGDGYDTIHWKATARRGHPITKTFQVEKTQEVYVIIDASRLSARLQVPGDPAQGTHSTATSPRRSSSASPPKSRAISSACSPSAIASSTSSARATARPTTAPAAKPSTSSSPSPSRPTSRKSRPSSGCACAAARFSFS
jgi:uncharacterized protein (DUF58 family)